MRSKEQVVKSEQGSVIGVVNQRGVFVRKVSGSQQMVRSPRGWSIPLDTLLQVEKLEATLVRVLDREDGTSYQVPLELFFRKGLHLDSLYGRQLVLPMSFWSIRQKWG